MDGLALRMNCSTAAPPVQGPCLQWWEFVSAAVSCHALGWALCQQLVADARVSRIVKTMLSIHVASAKVLSAVQNWDFDVCSAFAAISNW
jgi:hypothetical protein